MKRIIVICLILMNLCFFFSCSMIPGSAPDIEGVWVGSVESEGLTDGGVYIMEFMDTGRAKHSGSSNIIKSDTVGAPQYNWSINENNVKIYSVLTLYYAEYSYDLSEDETVLTLTLDTAWGTNSEHDYLQEGDIITFIKSDEEYSFVNTFTDIY